MLKLAASISAPAPKASEQEAEDASKTSLSNARAHVCTRTRTTPTHTHRFCFYSHSFFLTDMHNWTLAQMRGCTDKHACTHTQTEKHRPTKQDILARLLQGVSVSQFCVPSYVNRSLCVTSICLNEEKQAATHTGSEYLLLPPHYFIHCVKAQTVHAPIKEYAHTHGRMHVCTACIDHKWELAYSCNARTFLQLFYRSSQHTTVREIDSMMSH